jgi:ATP diphosphatase
MADLQLQDLLQVMQRLRDPVDGCPWDLRQTWKTILPSTLEEAYEVADAIEREDFAGLREELGDLLFQVVFYAQLGSEEGHFEFAGIVDRLARKLIRRHPHVFPDGTLESRREGTAIPESEIKKNWESMKEGERAAKGQLDLFADIPLSLPALTRSQKLQKRAAGIGFDWPDVAGVLDKIDEEFAELHAEIEQRDQAAIEHELGDLLFSVVNLCRHLHVDAESALRRANLRFEQRFGHMEEQLQGRGSRLDLASRDELEQCWNQAKLALAGVDG